MREGKWKLVSAYGQGANDWELYDLEADRTEMHDLAAAEPGKVKHLAALWAAWARRVGAQPWPLRPPDQRSTGTGATNGLRN